MKMENSKFKRIVETVESAATNSEAMMTMVMKKRKQPEFEESAKKRQQSSLNYDKLDKFIKDSVSTDDDLMRLRSGSGRVLELNCAKDESRCCHIVSDCSRSVDFEVKRFETVNSTSPNNKFSRETTPVSEICENTTTELMDTPARLSKASSSQKSNSPAVTMPSTAEIDEFFSKAEKYDQNRFAEKYNYDVVKDLPMDGRYEWILLKP